MTCEGRVGWVGGRVAVGELGLEDVWVGRWRGEEAVRWGVGCKEGCRVAGESYLVPAPTPRVPLLPGAPPSEIYPITPWNRDIRE